MPKKTPAKKTAFGADLVESMNLVLAHRRGEIELEQVWPKPLRAKANRQHAKCSPTELFPAAPANLAKTHLK